MLRFVLSCAMPLLAGASMRSGVFPVSVINLDKDTERLATVSAQLEASGIRDWGRLRAVYGAALSPKELEDNTTRLARLFATRGMIGCYLSHRTFWERTLASPEPWALVLEDDVILEPNFSNEVRPSVASQS